LQILPVSQWPENFKRWIFIGRLLRSNYVSANSEDDQRILNEPRLLMSEFQRVSRLLWPLWLQVFAAP
jgi:hypothetical protein